MTAALTVEDVRVTFHRRHQAPVVAVDGVSLTVPDAGGVGLVDESGCGKSTLARVITGIQKPDQGEVRLDRETLPPRRSRSQRRQIQLVFQDPYSSLNPRSSSCSPACEPSWDSGCC